MTVRVEVFSAPACGKCGQAKARLREVAEAMGVEQVHWREVNVLDDMDRAVELGVLSTPAIAINDRLVFNGTPTAKALRAAIQAAAGDASS